MSKLPIGPVPLLDPRLLLAKKIAVDEFFDINKRRMGANKGGTAPTDAQFLTIMRGLFTETPTLDQMLQRFEDAGHITLAQVKQAMRAELFPNGEQDLVKQHTTDFWQRRQQLVETPLRSGTFHAEPVLSYLEHKRYLLSKIPDAQRPPEEVQISTIIDGLIPALREKLDSRDTTPATLDALTQAALQAEKAIQRNSANGGIVSTGDCGIHHNGIMATQGQESHPTFTTTTAPGYQTQVPSQLLAGSQSIMGSSYVPSVPLELFGSPSIQWGGQSAYQFPAYQVMTNVMRPASTQQSAVATVHQEMDKKIASLQDTMVVQNRELQASINAMVATIGSRVSTHHPNKHYGPAEESGPEPCHTCGRPHRGKCWGKCQHCGDTRHPHWNCWKKRKGGASDPNEILKKVKAAVATELQQFHQNQQIGKKVKFTVGKDDEPSQQADK